jgi:hypothetical protein
MAQALKGVVVSKMEDKQGNEGVRRDGENSSNGAAKAGRCESHQAMFRYYCEECQECK